jgi:S1-C subfamily serine protease
VVEISGGNLPAAKLGNSSQLIVGINTLAAGQAETGVQAQGIGFASMISTAKPIADQLAATGKVIHP